MADNDDERRKRQREREDEREQEERIARIQAGVEAPTSKGREAEDASETYSATMLMAQAEPLIEHLNSLYNQLVAGVEKRPPLEKRQQLDAYMTRLNTAVKNSPSLNFKYSNLVSKYQTYRDRWDRMLKDLESGKYRRRA